MEIIEYYRSGSVNHCVVEEDSGFTICPTDDSELALRKFQVVARKAMDYSGEDYVVFPHPQSSGVKDMVFFQRVFHE